ncbi:MAG: SpoIIE family protein phosphatase [Lachnospiraceae bacterium]|nr:SpoIIE family protein phosphatase [Lachnospiraceae bacterium]
MRKKGTVFCVTALLFFAVTMPFRGLFAMAGLTEVRPAGAFPPVFGMLFGVPGALGCAVGNLGADILSGYAAPVCIYGFAAQFLYGWLPYVLWHGFGKAKRKEGPYFRSVADVKRYLWIIFADTLLMAAVLGSMLQLLGMGKALSQSTLLLFFNNLVFSVLLGIPMILLCRLAGGLGRRNVLTLNVRFVLIFLLLSVVSAALAGVQSYAALADTVRDPLKLWNSIYICVFADFFVMCGLSVCFLQNMEKKIIVPIEELCKIASAYARRGDVLSESGETKLAHEKNLEQWTMRCGELGRLSGETGQLASAFGIMLEEVEQYIQNITSIMAEKERIRTEILVASRLQADMLPTTDGIFNNRTDFLLAASMTPAKGVGGDFYDFFLLGEDKLALVMADVSGKGVPAALFMVVSRTLMKSRLMSAAKEWEGAPETENRLAHAVMEINDSLCANNKNGMFVTAWIGVLTLSTGELVFVNAGHCRPLIRRKDGACLYDTFRGGLVLAGMEEAPYQQSSLRLHPGDTLLLYTDGVTEATSIEKKLYGEERLKDVAGSSGDSPASPSELIQAVWKDVEIFQKGTEQFDDITLLAVTYLGNGFAEKTGKPDMAYIREFSAFIEECLAEKGVTMRTRIKILMAADEIFSNICYYSGAAEVTVKVRVDEQEHRNVMLCFEDDGIPYNPLAKPDPDIEEAWEQRKEGGLGIYLVKKRMDRVIYEYAGNKNCLTIQKQDL